MVALGTAAPEGSSTEPEIRPVSCARRIQQPETSNKVSVRIGAPQRNTSYDARGVAAITRISRALQRRGWARWSGRLKNLEIVSRCEEYLAHLTSRAKGADGFAV